MLSSSSIHVPLPPSSSSSLHPHILQFKPPAISVTTSLPSILKPLNHNRLSCIVSCSNSTSPESLSVPHQQNQALPDGSEAFDVELGLLLSLLPEEEMRCKIRQHSEYLQLIELVFDFGRKPLARFPSGDFVLADYPVTLQHIRHATSLVTSLPVSLHFSNFFFIYIISM